MIFSLAESGWDSATAKIDISANSISLSNNKWFMHWFVDSEMIHPCSAHRRYITFDQLVFKTSFTWDFVNHKIAFYFST